MGKILSILPGEYGKGGFGWERNRNDEGLVEAAWAWVEIYRNTLWEKFSQVIRSKFKIQGSVLASR